jgi:hypothetical protein
VKVGFVTAISKVWPASAVLAAAIWAFWLGQPVGAEASEGAFEPNDSLAAAQGPLAGSESYAATIAAPNDSDYFYFYVGSEQRVKLNMTMKNIGGGSATSAINAAIVDGTGNPIDSFGYAIGAGGEAKGEESLAAGKYFLRISPVEGSEGEIAYVLETGGEPGAFATYDQIAARCAEADEGVAAAGKSLRKAEGRLARAKGRVLRARYEGARARNGAAAAYRQAKSRVRSTRAAVKTAQAGRDPWCSVPQ